MVREELIDGAVTFLQDQSISSAPLEQKLAFLRSKNLTQEEIDASLARAGQSPPSSTASAPPTAYQTQYRQPPPQYGAYQQPPYWSQPPPDVPRRDWRDWFIMATVLGSVGYGMYWTAKRYVYPLIAPPTPPQLEQDKASIDASFDKAFALLDQLAADTQELKDSEKARKERLDQALSEVESVVGRFKEANEEREREARRTAKELDEIKAQIPQAIQKEKETMDNRLKDLAGEMKSLKTMMSNRVGQQQRPIPPPPGYTLPQQQRAGGATMSANGASTAAATQSPDVNGVNGTNGSAETNEQPASTVPERSASASPWSDRLGGKAQIPSWQLAAKKRSDDARKESSNEDEVVDT